MQPSASTVSSDRFAPALLVLLWSTGWLSASYAAQGADAMTFLSWRFAIAGTLLAAYALAIGAPWPQTPAQWLHGLVSGALLHGFYLGALWWAMRAGVSATISGLIAALQPILTAALAPLLIGERVSFWQRAGIALGFAGLALALGPKLLDPRMQLQGMPFWPVVVTAVGMVSVTFGTFYQKRFLAVGDLVSGAVVQYAGGFIVVFVGALLFEPMQINWSAQTIATLAWSVLGLSIGAILMMLMMIRRGAVARVATLFYLVPPLVAVEAFFLFGDRLAPMQIGGMVLTVLGVVLATRKDLAAPKVLTTHT